MRRQSAGLQAEKSQPTEDSEVDEVKYDVSHLQENLENENGPTSSEVHEEAKEDTECKNSSFFVIFSCYQYFMHIVCIAASGPANTEQVHAKKNIENKRYGLYILPLSDWI